MCFVGMDLVELKTVIPINPRPDIHIFKSQSTIIAINMDQLKYTMQKFTKLQHLKINFDLYSEYVYHDGDSAPDVLAQFFDYLMSIAVCKAGLTVPRSKFIDAWNEFIIRTDQTPNDSIVFSHTGFLFNFGGKIRSLQIEDIWIVDEKEFEELLPNNLCVEIDYFLFVKIIFNTKLEKVLEEHRAQRAKDANSVFVLDPSLPREHRMKYSRTDYKLI
ncbi:hypothetical protein BDF21DRAFT_463000 [Thamnidium elegans]|nr:hypothetical protein BDF21DRAFT_463000 [Thamnidium elegans]